MTSKLFQLYFLDFFAVHLFYQHILDCSAKKDAVSRFVPEPKPEPREAGPVWKGGARERSGWHFLQKNVGAKRTLLRRGSMWHNRFWGKHCAVLNFVIYPSRA